MGLVLKVLNLCRKITSKLVGGISSNPVYKIAMNPLALRRACFLNRISSNSINAIKKV
jgi:hypothetical protein